MKQIDKDTISLEWTTDDVKEQLKSKGQENALTTDECRFVLSMMLDKHDATVGVNWDVMDVYINNEIIMKESIR
jgi:hypothetical protein